MRIGFVLVALGLALLSPSFQSSADEGRPPNVVLIVTDDQRWDTLAGMSTLQSLAARNFTNGYATTPLCCPSRASILTGQYAHHHGVLTNSRDEHGGFWLFDDQDTLATRLQAAGYRTALVGKYLNEYGDRPSSDTYIPPGWSEWFAFTDRNPYFGFDVNDNGEQRIFTSRDEYATDVLVQRATAFIRDSGEKPFFLLVTPSAPHSPAVPAPRHAEVALNLSPWRPPNYSPLDLSAKPDWVRQNGPIDEDKAEKIDIFRERQIRTLLAVD